MHFTFFWFVCFFCLSQKMCFSWLYCLPICDYLYHITTVFVSLRSWALWICECVLQKPVSILPNIWWETKRACLWSSYIHNPSQILNRKEGNDQKSIQLPNTFRSKAPKGKKDALKVTTPQSKHYKQKAKRTVSSQKIGQTAIQKTKKTKKKHKKHHQDIHAKTYNTDIVNHNKAPPRNG